MVAARRCVVLSVIPGDAAPSAEAMHEKLMASFPVSMGLTWHEHRFRETGSEEGEEEGGIGLLLSCSVAEAALLTMGGDDAIVKEILTCVGEGWVSSAETWLTSPGRVPIAKVPLQAITLQAPDDAAAIPIMSRHGIACIPQAVPASQLSSVREEAHQRVEQLEQALAAKHPEISVGQTLFGFQEVSSRGTQRFDLRLRGEKVLDLAKNGPWVPMVRQLLGEEGECEASLVYSRPGAEVQEWHTDGAFLGEQAPWGADECSKPYAVCVFLALQDLDKELGFTQFWPGSHRGEGLAGFGDASIVLGAELDGLLGAGGCVIYDYRLMHRGMPNTSPGTQRDILQFLYHASWYKERKNYGSQSLFT